MLSEIQLKSSHIIIPPNLAILFFGEDHSVYVSFQETKGVALVSTSANRWFPKLHESKLYLLKNKDMMGTKSISIRELILDHDLKENDRLLPTETNLEKKFIKIQF